MRFLPVTLLMAFVLAAAPALAGGKLAIKNLTLSGKQKTYEYDVAYPQTGNRAIDAQIANWAKGMAADFAKEAIADAADRPYSMELTYAVMRNDDAMFVVLFQEEIDEGGVHPNHDVIAFNFLSDGWRVYLPEIFTAKGLAKISALEIADLNKQLGGPDGMSEPDWRQQGAGPDWDNFKDFALLANTLDIQYSPYQVAAYAAGPQEGKIALSALRDFFRTDWRAPAASFDCAAAKTAVEHVICSDMVLARLDRQASEGYLNRLKYETDAGKRDGIRNEQRAWLTRRNNACAEQTGGAAATCLSGVYRERMAALKTMP
jgi:uncharacterized protein YecT (DUF1311 family)